MAPKESSHSTSNILFVIKDGNPFDESETCVVESCKIEELGITFERNVLIKDVDEHLSCHGLNSNENEMANSNDKDKGEELELFHVAASNTNIKKGLERYMTFPCSKEEVLSSTSAKVLEERQILPMQNQSCMEFQDRGLSNSGSAIYSRSISLPAASDLVSALKGGREKQGQPSKLKLHVKWAPDVYDPPITLMSHTVKNHHQRPKPKKKDRSKQKQKGKSSRRSAGEKKGANHCPASSTCPLFVSFQAPADKMLLDGYAQSGMDDILDYAVGGKESKCGSSFLVGSLAKIQFPVAEAS